jgi:RNA binding exosome subunit
LEFSSVTVSFFIHSTEDEPKLLNAVRARLSIQDEEMTKERLLGYFGNEIVFVRAHIIGRRAQSVSHLILKSLTKTARFATLSEIEKSLDEHDSLYLRLDRQTINDPEISLSDEEPIRVKLKPKSRFGGRTSMKEQYEELIR